MGFLDVFNNEFVKRTSTGVTLKGSNALKMMCIEYSQNTVVDKAQKIALDVLHSKYNLVGQPGFPPGLFDLTVFWDVGGTTPTTSLEVLAMNQELIVADTFNVLTGTVETKYKVAIPATQTITKVIDIDAMNVDITTVYEIQGIVSVNIGGEVVDYSIYEMNLGQPYSTSHTHNIKIN